MVECTIDQQPTQVQGRDLALIYRTATFLDREVTLCTLLFDLDAGRLRIYTGHPVRAPTEFVELVIQ